MRGLRGRVALISGAASEIGMGFASARRLAEEGAKVVLTDIDREGVQVRANELSAAGLDALGLWHDVADEKGWDNVVAQTVDRYGSLDVLVNNAAISIVAPFMDLSLQQWKRQMDVTASSVFLGCRAATKQMLAQGRGGSIVNICSIASIVAAETGAAYCASKGAVHLLSKVLALEFARDGIRVNTIHPGRVSTKMLQDTLTDPDTQNAQLAADVPMGRLGLASDIAPAVAFLASDDSLYCTGTGIVIDGGFTAR